VSKLLYHTKTHTENGKTFCNSIFFTLSKAKVVKQLSDGWMDEEMRRRKLKLNEKLRKKTISINKLIETMAMAMFHIICWRLFFFDSIKRAGENKLQSFRLLSSHLKVYLTQTKRDEGMVVRGGNGKELDFAVPLLG
jgi:hypothetical protein